MRVASGYGNYVMHAAVARPRTGSIRRHHVHTVVLQRAVQTAVRQAEIPKAVSHTLRNVST